MPIQTGPLIDEESALLGRTNRRPKGGTRAEKGVTSNRFMIIVLLVAMVGVSLYFENQVTDLQGQLSSSQAQVRNISTILEKHNQVIDRFNSSVTNSDVISQLGALEQTLNLTSLELKSNLESVQKNVQEQLDQTVQQLSDTVTRAEQEIEDEVDKVKKDVEHYVVATQDQFSMENSFMVYQLAGTFTLLSCLISMWHMTAHLRKMNQPDVQRKILAILWMSPIYAITSWFSLVFHQAEGYLAIVKDGYEAYIIYQFLSFCISVIGRGDRDAVVDVLARHADHLTPPFRLFGCFEICGCCIPDPYVDNRALADAILLQCQGFAMQFVLFRPLTTTANVVLKNLDYYGLGDGPKDYRSPQFYITIVQNISIFVAFTGLLKFYHAVDKELAWCRPLAKFLCIKGVVFMTFWQGLAISLLAQFTDVGGEDATEWAMSAQNFLICLEMLLFSIAHFYCFPTEEWQDGYRIAHERAQFGDTIALGDFFQDVKMILTAKPKHHKKKRKSVTSPSGKSHVTSRDGKNADDSVLEVDVLVEGNGDSSSVRSSFDEEDGENDDDQSESSTESSSGGPDLNDEQQFVKHALEKTLGNLGDDPDIQEATKRLLESKVLSPDFFSSTDIPLGVEDMSEDAMEEYVESEEDGSFVSAEGNESAEESTVATVEKAKATNTSKPSVAESSSATPTTPAASAALSEKTPLLSPDRPTSAAEAPSTKKKSRSYEHSGLEFLKPTRESIESNVRPSIFTTIAKLDDDLEDEDEEAPKHGVP